MQVIIIKWLIIKLLKTPCFCTSSLEINQWNVHCLTPVLLESKRGLRLGEYQGHTYITGSNPGDSVHSAMDLRVSNWFSCDIYHYSKHICPFGLYRHNPGCSSVNSLWPSDTIWRQRSGSTLAQVMACCLTAPSHYLNQYCLIISEVQWHSY